MLYGAFHSCGASRTLAPFAGAETSVDRPNDSVPTQYTLLSVRDDIQERRSDHDVTNEIRVSTAADVRSAVRDLFESAYPRTSFDPVWLAFHDFDLYYRGLDAEYYGVDTPYHDIQHTLDMTLAIARLIVGYERTVESADRLGAERAKFALVSALFHDVGYLRHRERDRDAANGAEFTLTHVTRSGAFLERYLPKVGLADFAPVASRVVHFTGYEMSLDQIELEDPRDSVVGHLLGTGDLLAQLADRCYLEKCRDRLYPEFVLGNVAASSGAQANYWSGMDLLSKTLNFYQQSAQYRLEHNFNRAYRYVEALFDHGENPYMSFIRKNLSFLMTIKEMEDWEKLRRRPPCTLPDPHGEARLVALAMRKLRVISDTERENSARLRALKPAFNF